MEVGNNMLKQALLTGLTVSALLSSSLSVYAAAPTSTTSSIVKFQLGMKAYTDHQGTHSLDAIPFLSGNNIMVPLKALADSLNTPITWNAKTGEITLKGSQVVKLKLNDNKAIIGSNQEVKLPTAIVSIKGRTFVPTRSISELIGAAVSWMPQSKQVWITAQSPSNTKSLQYAYSFQKDTEGWSSGFADLPKNYNPEIYTLSAKRELIPTATNKTNYGFQLSGANRSDDLFMFMTKKLDGLKPNTTYSLKLFFDLYSDQGAGQMGIGGAPSEAVHMKAGLLSSAAKVVEVKEAGETYLRLNADKGNQKTEGKDMKLIGNISKPEPDKAGYQAIPFEFFATAKSNAAGELFLIIGTDSGYEGLTTLYYNNIKATLTEVK